MEVEDQRHPAQLRAPGREDQSVGHVVDLDQVEALLAVELADLARRSGQEAGVALEVGPGAAARLPGRGPVQADLAGPDRQLLVVVEADAVDPVAAFGQRPRLALDARVDDEIGVVDHADPQASPPSLALGELSYLLGLQSSVPPPRSPRSAHPRSPGRSAGSSFRRQAAPPREGRHGRARGPRRRAAGGSASGSGWRWRRHGRRGGRAERRARRCGRRTGGRRGRCRLPPGRGRRRCCRPGPARRASAASRRRWFQAGRCLSLTSRIAACRVSRRWVPVASSWWWRVPSPWERSSRTLASSAGSLVTSAPPSPQPPRFLVG